MPKAVSVQQIVFVLMSCLSKYLSEALKICVLFNSALGIVFTNVHGKYSHYTIELPVTDTSNHGNILATRTLASQFNCQPNPQ